MGTLRHALPRIFDVTDATAHRVATPQSGAPLTLRERSDELVARAPGSRRRGIASADVCRTPGDRDPSEHEAEGQAERLLLTLGTALHRHGAPAHRLETAMSAMAEAMAVEASFFSTPTALLVTFGPTGRRRTEVIRVEPGDVNLGRLAALDALGTQVAEGELDVFAAEHALAKLDADPADYGTVGFIAANALAAGSAGILLGGGLLEAWIGLVAGALVGGLLMLTLTKPGVPAARLLLGGCGFGVALLTGLGALAAPVSVPIGTLAGLIVLVPGLTLTVAVTELATRQLASGSARLLDGITSLMQLAFGSLLGARVAAAIGVHLGLVTTGSAAMTAAAHAELPGWVSWASVFAAGLCFAVLFRAAPRHVGLVVGASLLSWLAIQAGGSALGPEVGMFVAALMVGVCANAVARWGHLPASIVLVPGVILLVPGAAGFRTITHLIADDVVSGVAAGFSVALLACALAAGLLVAHAVLPARRSL